MIDIKRFFKSIGILNDVDQSKAVEITASSSSTTNTKTTINVKQTANRTLSTPNDGLTGEILTQDSVQAITNKTVALSNVTDNKLLVSEATTHKIVDSGITHTFTTDVTLAVANVLNLTSTNTKEIVLNGKSVKIPTAASNPVTGSAGELYYNTTNNFIYFHNGTSWFVLNPPVLSVNGYTGVVVLTTSDIAEGSNLYYTDARVAAAPGVTAKADQNLGNLVTTAINQSLLPNTNTSKNLGSLLLKWSTGFFNYLKSTEIALLDSSDNEVGKLEYFTATSPSGNTATTRLVAKADNLLNQTNNDVVANSAPTGNIYLESGNKLAGTGNSGDISLRTGTSAGGTRGSVVLDGNTEKHAVAGTTVFEDMFISNVSLTANVTNNVISVLTFPVTQYKAAFFDFHIIDNDLLRSKSGRMIISRQADNSNLYYSINYAGPTAMTFELSAIINGSNIEIRQTNNSTSPGLISGKFSMLKV